MDNTILLCKAFFEVYTMPELGFPIIPDNHYRFLVKQNPRGCVDPRAAAPQLPPGSGEQLCV